MWRSTLTRGRSHPFLSHLRHRAGCRAGASSAVVPAAVGSATPRAYASDAREADGPKPRPRPRRHLYVVLDETNMERSIYKLNIDDLDGGDEDAVAGANRAQHPTATSTPRRLPDPVLRLGYSSLGTFARFDALGDKIIAAGQTRHNGAVTFVYDTKTGRLDTGQPPPPGFDYRHHHAAATAVGNKLYTFNSKGRPLDYLSEQRELECYGYDSGDERMTCAMRQQINNEWVWRTGPLPALPGSSYVGSYAVHPDGRTIFVSCGIFSGDPRPCTYSLNTENDDSTLRGNWSLPFNGQAYYDAHLEAWVGIRVSDGTEGGKKGRRYLYFCDVPDLVHDKTLISSPTWKMCREELTFIDDDVLKQAALIHTGRGRFCLVETTLPPPVEGAKEDDSQCTCWNGSLEDLLHVTMFCAKHDKNGELVVSRCRPGHSYLVPSCAAIIPFWM